MAKQRLWITATPAGKDIAQAAINLAGYGDQIGDDPDNSSWVAYPDAGNVKLYYAAGVWDTTIATALGAVILGVLGTRIRVGKLRGTDPALTQAQCAASFPLPNIGPPADAVVTQLAAMWLHYRDFLISPFDNTGVPDVAPPLPDALLAKLVAQVSTAQTTKPSA